MGISRRTGRIAGLAAAAGLGLLAVAQTLELAGLGIRPMHTGEPFLSARLAAIFLLCLGCHLTAGRAGFIRLRLLPGIYDAGVWFTAVLLLLRGMGNFQDLGMFQNARTASAMIDIRLLSPLSLVIGAACLILALSPKEEQ